MLPCSGDDSPKMQESKCDLPEAAVPMMATDAPDGTSSAKVGPRLLSETWSKDKPTLGLDRRFRSMLAWQNEEFFRRFGQDFHAIGGDDNIVLDAHTAETRDINTRFDRPDLAHF